MTGDRVRDDFGNRRTVRELGAAALTRGFVLIILTSLGWARSAMAALSWATGVGGIGASSAASHGDGSTRLAAAQQSLSSGQVDTAARAVPRGRNGAATAYDAKDG